MSKSLIIFLAVTCGSSTVSFANDYVLGVGQYIAIGGDTVTCGAGYSAPVAPPPVNQVHVISAICQCRPGNVLTQVELVKITRYSDGGETQDSLGLFDEPLFGQVGKANRDCQRAAQTSPSCR